MDPRTRMGPLSRAGLGVALSLSLAACTGLGATPSPVLPAVPVTFVYSIDGPDSGAAHTTHLQLIDATRTVIDTTTLAPSGSFDTTTVALSPGSYVAIVWDEQPAVPSPILSSKCGAPFRVNSGLALVVTITNSRIGACITNTIEPGASSSPGPTESAGPASSPVPGSASPGSS